MAKYFLIFFSLMLCLSIGVFTVSNFTGFEPTKDSPTTETVTSDVLTNSTITSDPSVDDSKRDIPDDDKNQDQKTEEPKTPEVVTSLDERFQPDADVEKEEVKPTPNKKTAQSDSLDFSTFYMTKIKPFIQKVFGEEEIEVKTQTKEIKQIDAPKEITATTEVTNTTAKDSKVDETKTAKEVTKASEKPSPQKTQAQAKKTPRSTWKPQPKGTGWSIQIAAFRTEAETKGIVKKLEAEKIPNYTYETQVDGLTWYRITIGPFASPGEAAAYKQSHNIGKRFKGAFVRKL